MCDNITGYSQTWLFVPTLYPRFMPIISFRPKRTNLNLTLTLDNTEVISYMDIFNFTHKQYIKFVNFEKYVKIKSKK